MKQIALDLNLGVKQIKDWYYNKRSDIKDGKFVMSDDYAKEIGYDVVDSAMF